MSKFKVLFYNKEKEKIMEFFGYLKKDQNLEEEIAKMLDKIPPFIRKTIAETVIQNNFK